MPRSVRLPVLVLVLALVITAFQKPHLALATYTWYGASLYNWSFTRTDGTPLMFQQDTCFKCTASGTAAWQEYTWVTRGDNSHTPSPYPNGAQDGMWDYMMTMQTWSYANTSGDTTVSYSCSGSAYLRRVANISKDDGADPYAEAWGIYHYTPFGYYYHMIRYDDGSRPAMWCTSRAELSPGA